LNEWRRLRAWALQQEGWSGCAIAKALGVTPGAVSQWLERAREGGAHALAHRMPPGSAPRLTAEQQGRLPTLLSYGAEANGFLGDVWTSQRVAAVIKQEFGVVYHRAHVSHLLRQIGWSVQKPIQRATQRDEQAIARWTSERWPSFKAQSEQRTIVWADEAAFYPLPGVVRTYAPRGETPILHALLTRDHLSAISGLTLDGRLLIQIREREFRDPEVVAFLRHLLRHLSGPLLVIWDGAPIHRAQSVKDLLAQGAAARLQSEQLPRFAPELNPNEGVWNYLKHVELRNLCCGNLAELRLELGLAVKRLRHKRPVLRGCVAECRYIDLGESQMAAVPTLTVDRDRTNRRLTA
jgi:transposase